ncbi:MAG: type II toxin-antitoxin system HicA family toxin [Microcystis panniformis]
MSQYPAVKVKEFIKVIEKLGFYLDRQKGSHAKYLSKINYTFR